MEVSNQQRQRPAVPPPPPARDLTAAEAAMAVKLAGGKWTEAECRMIWAGMGPRAEFIDFQRFLYFCVQKDLDPLLNEVHAEFKYSSATDKHKMAIITHIEAYRRLADQTGLYDGQEEEFNPPTGEGPLISCTIRTFRKDCSRSFPYTAFYTEYRPDNQPYSNWNKMQHVMLRKVAEAASLRCAFPKALAGAYIGEEMAQAAMGGNPEDEPLTTRPADKKPAPPPPPPVPPAPKPEAPPASAPPGPKKPAAAKPEAPPDTAPETPPWTLIHNRETAEQVLVELRDRFQLLLGDKEGMDEFMVVLKENGFSGIGDVTTTSRNTAKALAQMLHYRLADIRRGKENDAIDPNDRETWVDRSIGEQKMSEATK